MAYEALLLEDALELELEDLPGDLMLEHATLPKYPGAGSFDRKGMSGTFARSTMTGIFTRKGMTGTFERRD